jgi:hypothetical protein
MLDKEFQYFVNHQEELVAKYNGRVIVIVGEEVIGDFSSEAEAYIAASKMYQPGSFLIQKCIPGKEAYKQTFNSRVAFV